MNARLSKVILPALVLACPFLLAAGDNKSAPLKPGDLFPHLDHFQLEGKLPETRDAKVVLVDFWASWCAPCRQSFAALNKLQKKFGTGGLTIIAVNVDEKPANMARFLAKNQADFPVVRDAAQKLVATLAVETLPTSLLIDQDGKVRHIHRGFREDETPMQYEREIADLLGSPGRTP